MYNLYPQAQKSNTEFKEFLLPDRLIIDVDKFNLEVIKEELVKAFGDVEFSSKDANIIYRYIDMPNEAYHIDILESSIIISSGSDAGAFYATVSLNQIKTKGTFYQGEIDDYPDLKIRGIMIDISRTKVPTLDTLKMMCYNFANLKINHVELYVEGFSFEYKSYPDEININKNYITLDEYLELEKYCNKYFIDLVPNENGFGHMADWLALPKYHDLAECPDGFYIWGAHRPPSTLDFRNPGSIKLVKSLYKDMIPYFKSQYFNMNFDEPVELGKGKNKEYVDEHGEANCYLEYFKVLCDEVKSYHKTPMLWGDVLIKHPESLKDIPKDVIFIDWGYDHKYDFRTHAAMLKENNVPFMTAPGTITWGTVVGKDIDMFGSIKHSADAAKEYGGLGILITDWGDFGHLQYLPASLPGFIYGACMAWSSIEEESFVGALGRFLPDLATVIMKLSCYSSIDEYRSYGNKLFTPIIYSEHASRYKEDHLEYFLDSMKSNIVSSEVYDAYKDFFNKIKIKLLDKEENIFRDELLNSTELLLLLNEIDYKIGMYIDNQEVSFDDEIDRLDSYKEEHYKLWIKRNKEAGYYLSVKRIEWLKNILMELNRKERK